MDERPPWERRDEDEDEATAPGDPTEGVRIIGAHEAQEAIERGEAAPRRPEGMPRYGDRPTPPPEGDRPALRFPRSGSAGDDPDAPRPRVAGTGEPGGGSTALPHWTEPPTGEVPRILPDGGEDEPEDDLEAWSSFATQGPRWRDQPTDWDDEEPGFEHDEESRVGALDETERPAPDDFFGFDEPVEEEQPAPVAAAPRRIRTGQHPPGWGGGDAAHAETAPRDVGRAALTGGLLGAGALVLFAIGPAAALLLVAAVIVLASAELFDALRRAGYRPATLLGVVATASLVGAAYWKGEVAIPLVLGLTAVTGLLWFLFGITRADLTSNLAVTILGVVYVGLLGSFAALILRIPDRQGVAILLGAVVAAVAYDLGGFFVGRRAGRAPLAPAISPGKTYEGLFGGMAAAILASVIVLHLNPWGVHPWDLSSSLALGVVVAVFAPLGDLCESMIKRDLGIKDMSSVLPGHGGLLDRFDAILFVLPATYYLVLLIDLV